MKWNIKSFNELTNKELYMLLRTRVDVFVVEQECPYPELDNFDEVATHYFLKNEDEILAYARILPRGTKYADAVAIGRVLVAKEYRGHGYAHELMNRVIKYILNDWQESDIKIEAQEYLHYFYSSLGFIQTSESYLEDGIPHIDMIFQQK